MSLLIISPTNCEPSYASAADRFAEMYKKLTGKVISISSADDEKSDLIVIGSDCVNDFLSEEMLEGRLPSFNLRYGTDDYCIFTYKKDCRKVLVFAGGRGRSTIYAVYDYFERFMGCHYFWDGDIIPHCDEICMENIHISESPRFLYRGLRYFAHRGLKRFQAEHWSFNDWKSEIDWLLKKRLNFFMLRIGMDDVWQRAFPEDCAYPDAYNIETGGGYDDRSDFWSLKERGILRHQVMDYAIANDLWSATDCGTMTHWYSKTPQSFIDSKHPPFLPQADNQYYGSETTRVFDFRKRECMDYYMKLTETMAEEYDKNDWLFHTIGLGERRIFKDSRKNFRLKLACYRKITQHLRKKYPNSKLLLAAWDFVGWWRPEEVQNLISELDPERTIILDYTSEGNDETQNFTNWGVLNKFPWIFGLFHAYESESELRGQYDIADARLQLAADDPFCKGMVLWPELSHSDPIILEYLTENSWSPCRLTLEELTEQFCSKRYGSFAREMNLCWQKFLPFMKQSGWLGYTEVKNDDGTFSTDSCWNVHSDIWVDAFSFATGDNENARLYTAFAKKAHALSETLNILPDIVTELGKITENTDCGFIKRDAIDIIRTICGRSLNALLPSAYYNRQNSELVKKISVHYTQILSLLTELLHLSDDFSLYATLNSLKAAASVNPNFEKTLKENISCEYCRQYCYELAEYLFKEESEAAFAFLCGSCNQETAQKASREALRNFKSTPLADMQSKPKRTLSVISSDIASAVSALSPELLQFES